MFDFLLDMNKKKKKKRNQHQLFDYSKDYLPSAM
jgi:hypothetical protein